MNSNHPVQNLLFYVAQDFDDETRAIVVDCVRKMATLREWVIGAKVAAKSIDRANPFGNRNRMSFLETVAHIGCLVPILRTFQHTAPPQSSAVPASPNPFLELPFSAGTSVFHAGKKRDSHDDVWVELSGKNRKSQLPDE